MSSPPYDLTTFDYKDPVQLKAMHDWAGSYYKLCFRMNMAGRAISDATLSYQGRKNGMTRGTPGALLPVGEPVSHQPKVNEDSAKELLAYLRNRSVPRVKQVKAKDSGQRYLTEVIGFDLHAPLHHEGAWEVFKKAIERLQPDGVTLGGDVLDLAQISRFVKKPSAVRQLQADLDWARDNVFGPINEIAPKARRTMILGNHEGERWENYLWSRVPEIAELRCLDMGALLGLDELGWCYEPDGYELIPDTFMVEHGDRHTNTLGGGSAQSARKEMIDTGLSGASGHTHHMGKFWRYDNAGYRVWTEGGCLCDQIKMREHRVTARKRGGKREDWHLGFLVIYYSTEHESFEVVDVSILQSHKRTFAVLHGEEIST